jgi:4-amino-4-deoxy-L-arabinose transferase-like glycosyltransferase
MLGLGGRYGYHRDELYYLVAGRHPAWGYDDQPPLAPMLARSMDALFPGSVAGLRLPSAVAVAVIVLLAGLLARDLGGSRPAQLLAAGTAAATPVFVVSGHLLSTTILDILFWTLLSWLLVRWIRVRDDRLLLLAGPVAGLALLNKSLVVLLAAGILCGVLLAGPRQLLTRPALWLAAVVAAALWVPNLWWQATHDWPQLEMSAVIRDDQGVGGVVALLPNQLLLLGPPLAAIAIAGLWRLLRTGEARPYRAFGWAFLVVLALTLVTGGREYYPAGLYPVLVAAGAVATGSWWSRGRVRTRRSLVGAALALGAVSTVVIALPVYPVDRLADTPQAAVNYDAVETVGWPELAETVAEVYDSLPESQRATAVILTRNYGQAGAIDRYGRPLGLPAPYSGHLNFWRWGPPPDTATGPVILVGVTAQLAPDCGTVTLVARHDNGYGLDNEEQGVPVSVCDRLTRPWSEIWPQLHRFS